MLPTYLQRFSSALLVSLMMLGNVLPAWGQEPLFTLLPAEQTGVFFENQIIENQRINILTYEYFHNGGGVAIGDLNNDGLSDIFLTGNLAPNRLYFNQGNMTFEDVTQTAGVIGTRGWYTGTTLVDINNDGWLDIYTCLSGNLPDPFRANQLYVNNQDGTFTERAQEYGIADVGYATQATFFDYDLDGDLDLFILNHNVVPISDFKPSQVRNTHDPHVGDKLYRNDNGTFTDVSQSAGIYTNALGYGLGVSIGDLNGDHYPDIYVANDFIEHDYCYMNKGDGTFRDVVKSGFNQISQFSMGTDMADINNDGLLDIMTVDMIAEDNYRQKTTMRPMNRSIFYFAVEDGFHYQYMHNALQLNRGRERFSNISKLAGISSTDWSWAPLLVDLDMDGYKDFMVTNGYKKDISNKDYVSFEKKQMKAFREGKINNTEMFRSLLDAAPVTKIGNYVFKNNGDYTFSKMNEAWNFEQEAFSNGAAYGDLDNDGDLDLVINNIDDRAFVYQNQAMETRQPHYLRLKLKGALQNPLGLGAKVWVHTADGIQYFDHSLSRGFQSSMDPVLCIGLGTQATIDRLEVRWPDGKVSILTDVQADRELEVAHAEAMEGQVNGYPQPSPLFEDVTHEHGLQARHVENAFDDFDYEVLLPHKMSNWGPGLAVGDVNGDGRSDVYLGGANGFEGQLYLQQPKGQFELAMVEAFEAHATHEDLGATFFDADADGDLDLYVVSGGNEFEAGHAAYQDRLYINDGRGNFTHRADALPAFSVSGSVVRPSDVDADGDLDLFVGGRMLPRLYPRPADSRLLINEGGTFRDATLDLAPALEQLGMVTDARWMDLDADGDEDLVIMGEWMAPTLLENQRGLMVRMEATGLEEETGWWFSVEAGDFDEDGDLDFVAGNLGTNYKYKASYEEPFQVFLNDFDESGSQDIVLGYFDEGTLFPVRGRQCSSEQMPFIKKKFPTYDLFGKADLKEIYGEESLDRSLNYKARNFRSSFVENLGNGKFKATPLPVEAQMSALNDLLVQDVNGDGHLDVFAAGNLFASEVETPRNDAGVGVLLLGNGKGGFEAVPAHESGIYLPQDIKQLALVRMDGGETRILAAPNNDALRLIKQK